VSLRVERAERDPDLLGPVGLMESRDAATYSCGTGQTGRLLLDRSYADKLPLSLCA
jgi:hypothetical protein